VTGLLIPTKTMWLAICRLGDSVAIEHKQSCAFRTNGPERMVLSKPDAVYQPQSTPRLACRDVAAKYCGLSRSAFSDWVRIGRLPTPIIGTARWDLKAIDRALDSLSGIEQTESSALDDWRVKRARRSEGNS
jgi:hypothetical protein